MPELEYLTAHQQQVYELEPLLRICLARDILWDLLRNELRHRTNIGGFQKEDILEAWKALELGPHPYAQFEEDRGNLRT